MKRTIPALLLSAFVISSASRAAAIDPKLTAFYAQDKVIEVEIFSSEWDHLRTQDPRGGQCVFGFIGEEYDWFHFDEVRINGSRFHDVGVKKRAWCGSESKTKPSLNIKFNKFNKGQGDVARDAIGVDNLLLNNSAQDPAYVRQCLAYRLWAKAGVAAPLCNFAHVRVNNRDLGIYVSVQHLGATFLQFHYGDRLGNLYEVAADDFADSSRDHLRASLDSMKEEEDQSLSDVGGIIDALKDKARSIEKVERLVDLDEFFRYWAMEIIVSHFDGFTLSNNNAYLYFPANGKMQILPWGADNVLTRTSDREARQIYNFNLLARMLSENTAMRQRLLNTISEQLRLFWNEKELQAEVDHTAFAIGRFIASADQGSFFGEIETLKKNIRLRREQIASFIPVSFTEMSDARLQNTRGYRFCLNIQGFDDHRITNVWGCGDDPDQRWSVTYVTPDYVRLRNPGTNNCVDLQRLEAGAPVDARTCHGVENQNWKVLVSSGAYLFESQKAPGMCLSLGEEEDSSQTVIKNCDRNDPTQNWRRFFGVGE
jgi:hypothetical protein